MLIQGILFSKFQRMSRQRSDIYYRPLFLYRIITEWTHFRLHFPIINTLMSTFNFGPFPTLRDVPAVNRIH